MAKLKIDLTGQDPKESVGRELAAAPIGVHTVKIRSVVAEEPDDKQARLVVTADIMKPAKNNYFPLKDWIVLESEEAAWKLDQFLQACGVASATKRKIDLDTEKLKNKIVRVRVFHDTQYDPENPRAKVGTWFEPDGGDAGKPEKAAGATKKATGKKTVDDEISLEMHGAAADEAEDAASIEYLTKKAAEFDLDPDEYPLWAELATAIEEAEQASEGGDEGEDEEGPDLEALGETADNGEEEEAEAAQADLTLLAEEAGLDTDDYPTWAELAAALGEAEGEGEGEGDDETPDYASMSLADLKRLCKERDLPTSGTRETIVERLEEFDSTDPFQE